MNDHKDNYMSNVSLGKKDWLTLIINAPQTPTRRNVNSTLWTLLLSHSKAFLNAVIAESMQAFLYYACIFNIAEADGAVKFRA